MRIRRPFETPPRFPLASRHRSLSLILSAFIFIGWLLIGSHQATAHLIDLRATPSPTPPIDRLATPVIPSSPTPIDLGRMVYYMNCMPCHGDRGQGLTDEWRAMYVEDSNCWERGCHGGREGDQGYPLPRTIPAVIGSPPILARFQNSEALHDYLRTTHPPQRPGALTDDDYRNVTAFVWSASGRSMPEGDQSLIPIGLAISIGLVVMAAIVVVLKRRQAAHRSIDRSN